MPINYTHIRSYVTQSDVKAWNKHPHITSFTFSKAHLLSDVSFLEQLQNASSVRSLHLSYAAMTCLKPIAHCSQLEVLYLGYCLRIQDISALGLLTELRDLNLNHAVVLTNIQPLKNCRKLRKLDLSWTKVEELTALHSCEALIYLDVSFTRTTDVENISLLPALEKVRLVGSCVRTLVPLGRSKTLQKILISHLDVVDKTGVAELVQYTDSI
eukprot:Colp12_sorted_trinity150504_noHs@19021